MLYIVYIIRDYMEYYGLYGNFGIIWKIRDYMENRGIYGTTILATAPKAFCGLWIMPQMSHCRILGTPRGPCQGS